VGLLDHSTASRQFIDFRIRQGQARNDVSRPCEQQPMISNNEPVISFECYAEVFLMIPCRLVIQQRYRWYKYQMRCVSCAPLDLSKDHEQTKRESLTSSMHAESFEVVRCHSFH